LLEQGLELLRRYLPEGWEVQVMSPDSVAVSSPDPLPARDAYLDSVVQIGDGGSIGRLMVETKTAFGPRDVDALLGGINRTLRRLAQAGVLVIAPSLSGRTRELLAESGVNYLDLAGNIRIRLTRPGLYIERVATTRTSPRPSGAAGLRGPRAGRLVRALVDAAGTWTVAQLAATAGLSASYVSKLLDSLEQEALVQRGRRGVVEDVDWRALLRTWARSYNVLESNTARRFIARHGAPSFLHDLAAAPIGLPRWVVTGSYGAVTLAPYAAPAVLMLYTPDAARLTGNLEQLLLPADVGADVIILRPSDEVVFERAWTAREQVSVPAPPGVPVYGGNGYPVAAPSQLAVDCLGGPGRMPAEGEALIAWMVANETRWRAASPDEIDRQRLHLNQVLAPW